MRQTLEESWQRYCARADASGGLRRDRDFQVLALIVYPVPVDEVFLSQLAFAFSELLRAVFHEDSDFPETGRFINNLDELGYVLATAQQRFAGTFMAAAFPEKLKPQDARRRLESMHRRGLFWPGWCELAYLPSAIDDLDKAGSQRDTGGAESPARTLAGHPSPKEADTLSDRDSGGTARVHPMKTDSAEQRLARVEARLERIEQLLLAGKNSHQASPRDGLTTTEQELFEKLNEITGKGAKARKEAQQLILACLPGQKISQALTLSLREYLKSRGWGIRCKCGMAAGIRWNKDDRLQKDEPPENRGAMVISHLDDKGRHAQHLSFTVFPDAITLVERHDARRKSAI